MKNISSDKKLCLMPCSLQSQENLVFLGYAGQKLRVLGLHWTKYLEKPLQRDLLGTKHCFSTPLQCQERFSFLKLHWTSQLRPVQQGRPQGDHLPRPGHGHQQRG